MIFAGYLGFILILVVHNKQSVGGNLKKGRSLSQSNLQTKNKEKEEDRGSKKKQGETVGTSFGFVMVENKGSSKRNFRETLGDFVTNIFKK